MAYHATQAQSVLSFTPGPRARFLFAVTRNSAMMEGSS